MEWINCKDKLPPEELAVIIYVPSKNGHYIFIGSIIPENDREKDYFWAVAMSEDLEFLKEQVTHWMPLPDAPK